MAAAITPFLTRVSRGRRDRNNDTAVTTMLRSSSCGSPWRNARDAERSPRSYPNPASVWIAEQPVRGRMVGDQLHPGQALLSSPKLLAVRRRRSLQG